MCPRWRQQLRQGQRETPVSSCVASLQTAHESCSSRVCLCSCTKQLAAQAGLAAGPLLSCPFLRLFLNVQQFVDFSHHVALFIFDDDLELRFDLGLRLGRGADFGDLLLAQVKSGLHQALSRLFEADGGGLVPDDVIRPENVDEHEHVKRIDHGVQRTAEVSADVIAVVEAQRHLDFNVLKVLRNPGYAHSGAQVRRVEVDAAVKFFCTPAQAVARHSSSHSVAHLVCAWNSAGGGLEWFMCTIRQRAASLRQSAVPRAVITCSPRTIFRSYSTQTASPMRWCARMIIDKWAGGLD